MTKIYKRSTLVLSVFYLLFFTISAQDETFTMTQIGADNLLDKPWDLLYGPDGYLWVTERESGTVSRINPETAEKDVLLQISDVYAGGGQDGLLGMALHKDFLGDSAYVYLSYTRLYRGARKQRIVRYTYTQTGNDGSLTDQKVLIDDMPGSNDHNSGRLIFGLDNKLYYTIGDQGVKDCNTNLAQKLPTQAEIDAQNWAKYPGKTLRLNSDGSIPEDNPVINGVQSHIFTYGHRNPQGIVMSSTGLVYSDEHGPSSDDEANLIQAGKNYGWPFVAGVKDNLMYDSDGCLTHETEFDAPNYQDPLFSLFTPDTKASSSCSDDWMCRPNIAPSSLEVYESNAIPGWKNSLLLTSLKRGRVYRLKLNAAGDAVVGGVTQNFYTQNRYRDIVSSPDGLSFYIITDESGKTADASGFQRRSSVENPGVILKFTYEDPLSIHNKQLENPVNIYPNPATGVLNIDLKTSDNLHYKAQLVNTKGQVVNTISTLLNGENGLDVSDLPKGVYILKLNNGKTTWHDKVVLN